MSKANDRRPPGFLSLKLKDRRALQSVYLPFLRDGGLFVPSLREFQLGEQVLILLRLPEQNESLPVAGRVAWIVPAHAARGGKPGIGVQLSRLDGGALRSRIETLIADQDAERGYRL